MTYRWTVVRSLAVLLSVFCGGVFAADANSAAIERVVSKIEISGNVAASTNQVLAKIRMREGDFFVASVAAEDAKRIAELDAVDYAYYNTEVTGSTVKLTYVVVEKLPVRAIQFEGNKEYSGNKLKKKVDFKRGDFLSRFLVEQGRDSLLKFYKEKGYAFAEIEIDQAELAKGIVKYNVNEGPRVKVKSVEFAGNTVIPASELKKVIKTSTRSWVLFQGYYQQVKLDDDVVKILKALQKRGHLDAKVSAAPEFNVKRNEARVVFTVVEGPVYHVESVTIEGNKFFDTQTLASELRLVKGAFYSEERADFDAKKILKKYRETGFIDTMVTPERNFVGPTQVAAKFSVIEGERFRIGQINITGNEQTHDKVARRVLDEEDFKPGEWYNADIARGDGDGELEKALRQNTMMESAFIKPTGDKPGQKDAQVSLTEGQTGMVMLGAGVSSDAGIMGQIVFEQRNFDIGNWPESWSDFFHGQSFKGAGQRLRIALEPGTEVSQYSVTFTEPFLMDKPIEMTIGAAYWMRGRESYDETRTKAFIGFDKRYKGGWHQGITTRFENVNIDDIDDDAPREVKEWAGNNFLTGVKYDFGRNTTDNKFNPTRGYIWDLAYEQVYVDETFGIASASHRWYKTIREDLAERKTILGTKLFGGQIIGDAPVFEKFYAGGIGSMRGFDYRGVSTRGYPTFPGTMVSDKSRKKKDPIGSDWIFLAGSEVAFPLASETFQGLLFVDSGTIDSGPYRVSVGTGLQILIPQWFGPVPMRFEFAMPVSKGDRDETRVFSFSVGRLF